MTFPWGLDPAARARQARNGRIAVAVAGVVLLLFFAGVWIDFAPAPWLGGLEGYVLCFVIGLLLTLWLVVAAARRDRLALDGPRHWLLVLPFAIGFVVMPIVCKLLPGLGTLAIGRPVVETHRMWTDTGGRRTCTFQLRGGPMHSLVAQHLCIDQATYVLHQHQAVDVTMQGRRSALGLWIESFEVRAAAD